MAWHHQSYSDAEMANPEQQGLKLHSRSLLVSRCTAEMANPEQQGLKLGNSEARDSGGHAEMANPEQQGLKPTGTKSGIARISCRNG